VCVSFLLNALFPLFFPLFPLESRWKRGLTQGGDASLTILWR
jgi:hypothetical protein